MLRRIKKNLHNQLFILHFALLFMWETDKKRTFVLVVLNIVVGFVFFPILLLDKAFIDILIANENLSEPLQILPQILVIMIGRLVFNQIKDFSTRVTSIISRNLFSRSQQRMELEIGRKHATLPVPIIESYGFKDRFLKIEREGMARTFQIAQNFLNLIEQTTGMLSALLFFVFGQPLIPIILILTSIPGALIDRKFIIKRHDLESKNFLLHRIRSFYQNRLSKMNAYLELRLLNIHEYCINKIKALWEKIISKREVLEKRQLFWGYIVGVFESLLYFLLELWFAFQALFSIISIGSAQAYMRAISNFNRSFSNVLSSSVELFENYLYCKDVVWFLGLETPDYNASGAIIPRLAPLSIDFSHVSFQYPGTKQWILSNLSLTIQPKEKVAIVGVNGAGKTTLIKLLCGFYSPQKGHVTVARINVCDLNKQEYWQKISVQFQDFGLYGISARESIGVGNLRYIHHRKRILDCAKLTGIDEWILSLPKKLDTPLIRDFPYGVSPSTGQAQKIGLARALFKDASILVLDEPTSNVDPLAEEEIFNTLLKITRDKTLLFISHRFSTVRRADRILVLDKGNIAEQGNHQALMNLQGLYYKLFSTQAKNYQE